MRIFVHASVNILPLTLWPKKRRVAFSRARNITSVFRDKLLMKQGVVYSTKALIPSDEVMSLRPPHCFDGVPGRRLMVLRQTRHEPASLIRCGGDEWICSDRGSEHHCSVVASAKQNDAVAGLMRARRVTVGDVSRSCSGLTGGLRVRTIHSFSSFHLAPCMELLMFSSLSWWFFFYFF